jgi:alpha-L-rhamnosidase
MGLLAESDWQAPWICGGLHDNPPALPDPAPFLRRAFDLPAAPVRARLYLAGVGYHEAWINGAKVGDAVLDPAPAQYDRTVWYRCLDVTAALRAGANALGVILGTGWFFPFGEDVWNFTTAPWKAGPRLRCLLVIEDADGRVQRIASGPEWRCAAGPIVCDGLRNGETYDARLELPGWSEPGFADAAWKPARIVPGPGGVMRSQQSAPVRVVATRSIAALTQPKPGVWVFDAGQSLSGWGRIRVQAPAGTEIVLRYGEKLTAEGALDQKNIDMFIKHGGVQTDRYRCKGGGVETWEPRFTYHGFRYVEVTGLPAAPAIGDLDVRVVHSDLGERGGFASSLPLLDAVQRLARWSTLTNFHHLPTDCPHREKNGWTGDASLSAEQTLLYHDPQTSYRRWLADIRDAQRPSGQLPGIIPSGGWGYNWGGGPAWDSVLFTIPWNLWRYRGDHQVLAENLPAMRRWLDFAASMADADGIVGWGLGDWCPPHGGAGDYKCPTALTDTAYWYEAATITAETCAILGEMAEAVRLRALAARIRAAWRARFLDPASGAVAGESQTGYAAALWFGMCEPAERPRVLARLVALVEAAGRHHDCGILGNRYLYSALSNGGRADLALAVAVQRDRPSFGWWIERGATTMWEDADGGNSLNHHMFADVTRWFHQSLVGIRPAASGFQRILFAPEFPAGLDRAEGWHVSPYGRIACAWERTGGRVRIAVSIPANCTGELRLAVADAAAVRIDGAAGQAIAGRDERDRTGFTLASGDYVVEAALSTPG